MKIFTKTQLTAAVFLALQSFNAHSLLVDLDISTSSTADTPNVTDSNSGTGDNISNAYSSASANEGQNYATNTAIGRSNGSFYNRANGNGNFSSSGHMSQLYTVTNNTLSSQNVNFDFQVLFGNITTNCGDNYDDGGEGGDGGDFLFLNELNDGGISGSNCTGNDFAQAEYNSSILLNGVSIWGSFADILTDATGSTSSFSGTNLGSYTAGSSSYYWNQQDFSLDLGSLAINEILTLEYVVDVSASGFAADPFNTYNYAKAHFGDPNGFGSTGNSIRGTVPEPMTLGLLASGLFSFGFIARKRKQQA